MRSYTDEITNGFPEVILWSASTPATHHLFKVRDEQDAEKLPEEQASDFHQTVAQLLFLSDWAHWDIQTTVAFLTMMVKSSDEDHWEKVKRVLKYLNGAMELGLTLPSVVNLGIIQWYINPSFGCYDDSWRGCSC